MSQDICFKILQRRNRFRNPNHLLSLPSDFSAEPAEIGAAEKYLKSLVEYGISWTYPGHADYPETFYQMKEPPLFLEFKGKPLWKKKRCLSVVGSRKIHSLSKQWMEQTLEKFLQAEDVAVVSGGAYGVDQLAHRISLKVSRPTVVVVPSGLVDVYPPRLEKDLSSLDSSSVCFVSEFETDQQMHKSHFFFRNRLIAAFGEMTLLVQAETRSGSLLTIHHALENGRPVVVVPSHPALLGFSGNTKLLKDGAYSVATELDLLDFWRAEIWAKHFSVGEH